MRGRPGMAVVRGREGRRIPARAGATSGAEARQITTPEDPRACGGDCEGWGQASLRLGGSPRVRGRLSIHVPASRPRRRIPARAGATPSPAPVSRRSWEDPRACGGDGITRGSLSQRLGGSPRVRGRHLLSCGHTSWSASFPSVAFRSATEIGTKVAARLSPPYGHRNDPGNPPGDTNEIPRRRGANSRSPCVRNTAQAGSRMPGVDSTMPRAEASRSRASPQARDRRVGGAG